jgi:hypothetical protein
MYDADRFLTACMPLLPIVGSLCLLCRLWLLVEAWFLDLISENKAMKKQLHASQKQLTENRLEQVHKQLDIALDQLKDTNEENGRLRAKSPAPSGVQSGRVLRSRRLASP